MMGSRKVWRALACALLALLLSAPAAVFAASGNNNDSGNNGGNNTGSNNRGRGLSELMFLIVKLTGEQNWGQVRVIGPAGDSGSEERSDSRDYF